MVSKYTYCSITLLCLIVQYLNGAASSVGGYYDDEDCNIEQIPRRSLSYGSYNSYGSNDLAYTNTKANYEEVFDGHRRLIFPKIAGGINIGIKFNTTVTGRFVHPYSKNYVINISFGILNIPKYIRLVISWIRFLIGLTDKAKTFILRLVIRSFKLFIEWPLHRAHLIMNFTMDIVSVLKYLIKVMFPEWTNYNIEMIFEGYASGSVSLVVVYKRIFKLIYPEWPAFEVNMLFDGTDSLVIVLERLILQLYPNWSNTNYIFQGSLSVSSCFKKFLKLVIPTFNVNTIVSNSNSIFAIFEKVFMILFPGWPNENTFLIGWTFLKLLYPYYIEVSPKLIYYKTGVNQDQKIIQNLLDDMKVDIGKEITTSSVDLRKLFLISFAGKAHGADLSNKLSGIFDALFGEFSIRPQGVMIQPIKFDTSNLVGGIIIGGVPVSSNWWNSLFPEEPMPIEPIVVKPTPRPTPSPGGPGRNGGIELHITWAGHSIPILQGGSPDSGNTFCRLPNQQYNVIPLNIWLQKLNPSDEVLKLLFLGEPGFDMNIVKSDYVVPEALLKLVVHWDKYQNTLSLYGKIPLTHVLKFFLPTLLYKWPQQAVIEITHDTTSIRLILQRALTRIFHSWAPFLPASVTPVHVILKRLLLTIMPDIPKTDLQTIFDGTTSLSVIFKNMLHVMFPNWPKLDVGYIPKHLEPKIIQKLLEFIFNWSKYESIVEIHSAAALPKALSKLILLLVPDIPQYEIDMIVHGKVGLSLLISRFINILNPAHVIALDINIHDEHTLEVPYWAFEVLFANWPHYEADLNDKNLQTTPAFRRCLNWLRSQIASILHKASCSDPIVYTWVGELATALLEYSIETLPSVYEEKRMY